ncbi:hypothetical protein DMN77_08170 [Paenibacillus sp. 79R4]|uniref:hypothetical protein n=1 Tax=Paenibacillus sp. 79R4 TaxID=2212847 RepID=UPI0015BCC739|nr:hypothetical protein [Paenibacillus sp. 79R4]NWL87579.1 hypothetical protein [Paenibacillus sp. 79R4]
MKERLTKERLEQLKQRYRDFGSLHWMDAQEIVIELEQVQSELTEKDATIKKFEDDAMYWYREAEKARFMFLAAHDEHKRTRKALEDAKDSIQVIEAHGERPWEVTSYCDRAIELIDDVLGEGDKE